LQAAIAAAASAVIPARLKAAAIPRGDRDYGRLAPAADRIRHETVLELPKDFSYVALTADGDKMRDGFSNPSGPRQLGCFRLNGQTYVARNHVGSGVSAIGPEASSFRPSSPGGIVCLILESGTSELLRDWCLMSGLESPTTGTRTPWGSWLAADADGNIFEAKLSQRELSKPAPLRPFGGLRVDRLAYDPAQHHLFAVGPNGRTLLRWTPKTIPDLSAGGVTHTLTADWQPRGSAVTWSEGLPSGAATAPTIRALLPRDDGLVLLTDGSKAGTTDLWSLEARQRQVSALRRLHTIDLDAASINQVGISPRGGLVIAAGNRIVGMASGQKPFDLVRAITKGQSIRGVCFSLDGETLLATLDQPGIFVGISGPWEKGPL